MSESFSEEAASQDDLRAAAAHYLSAQDVSAFERFLQTWPHKAPICQCDYEFPLCQHDYPESHRILDVVLLGRPFRFARCGVCNERLFLYGVPVNTFSPAPGVPLWLTGPSLQRWIAHEQAALQDEDYDPDAPIDWTLYAENSPTT